MFPDWAAHPKKHLAIGLDCSLHWGSPRKFLTAFRASHPEVLLRVKDADEVRLAHDLKTGEIDAVIAPYATVGREQRIVALWSERLIAATPEGHPLSYGNEVAPAQLRDQVIMLAGDDAHHAIARAIVAALGGPPAAFTHYPVERDTLFDLVALGLGLTISPGGTLGAFYPGVCLRPIASKAAKITYGVTWVTGNANPALHDFLTVADLVFSRRARPDGLG